MALTAGIGSSGAEQEDGGGGELPCGGEERRMRMRREHMFDKVVTPSDVGKLNRLVVPKHFAERHFLPQVLGDGGPGRVAGAVLRFKDGRGGGGKSWEFRFSYWGSSQSYVMTKGWSSFVRDRRLSAGDTVSFYRAGESLFIDCRRRGFGVAASVPAATRLVVPASVPQVVTLMHQRSTSSDERAPRSRCVRLFGVDLELTGAGAEQLPLDLQLALMRR